MTRRTPTVLVALVAAIAVVRFGFVVAYQLPAQHDLAYESPNLSTAKLIQEGRNPYAPEVYSQSPFVLTIYTPAYHYLVSLLPTSGANPFFYGRLITLVCMLLSAAALFALRREDVGVPLVAVAMFFLVATVASNAVFLKNDTAALCCSVWAVALASRGVGSPRRGLLIAALCVLAIASKQSYIAASVTVLLLCRGDRRVLASWGILLAGCLGFASLVWGYGFWFSVVLAPQNPMLMERWTHVWGQMLRDPAFLVLLVLIGVQFWKRPKLHPFGLYAAVSWLVLLATVAKAGSSTNYFIEPILATLGWMVAAGDKRMLAMGGAVMALAVALLPLPTFTTPARSAQIMAQQAQLRDELQRAEIDPRAVLNLHFAPLGFAAGEPCQVNDPLLYGLVYAQGRMSTQPLLDAIHAKQFDAVLWPEAGSIWLTSPRLADVRAAVEQQYPRTLHLAGQTYRTR